MHMSYREMLVCHQEMHERDEEIIARDPRTYPYYPGRTYNPSPGYYVPKTVHYVEDYIKINMVDRKTNELILSVTSEADINLGDEIPNSANCISKNLFKEYLKLQRH